MTTISSAGVGSGLNIESIVTALMSVEKQPLTNLEKRQTSYESKISALGTLKGALSSLQTAAKALTPASTQTATAAFSGFKATLADSTIATATTTSAAVAGTYSVEVGALATNQRLALGKTYDAGAAVLDFGSDTSRTLTLTKGGTAVDITLDSSQNTLAGVRDAINNASAGVSATIVTDTSGKQNLLLTATDGGTANAVSISGTATFIDPANPGSPIAASSAFNQTQAATDASVKIQGISIATSGNKITDAIDGVTLEINKTGTTNLTVARDNTDLKSKLETFVNAYNSLNSSIKSLGAYNSATKTAAALNGDSTLRSVQSQVRTALTSVPADLASNPLKTLSDIGISFQPDGSLKLDSTKFEKAASTNFSATANVIGAFGNTLKTTTTDLLATNGVIASRSDGLSSSVKALDRQMEAMENRLTIIEKNYRARFTSLDTTMTSMSTTSSYLNQQLTLLSNMATNN
ncbi:flagellar filament capping protein FliD [Zoogloea sp.]|uniref:flagellar filament capping protein FliD n=1 Tax=Zoogloea sp. TaxID=49181 RepID=UPI002608678D|nr:flagellar filament capping protein FliD [uncultured Zoogloea sp.]MCK6389103.1 flagellar filament capping protein FliD [Zoogloea sp.]